MALFSEKRDASGQLASKEEVVSTKVGDVHTILGPGSEFEGKLTFEGEVRIDGKFSGQIATKDKLVVGERAKVMAEISAGTAVVNGTVEGNIKASSVVELSATARVKGSIEAPSLQMARGAVFDGNCKMENLGGKAQAQPPGLPIAIAK